MQSACHLHFLPYKGGSYTPAGCASRATVASSMTRDVLSCSSEAEVEDACELMEKRQVRRLLVTGQNEVPVGIVSLGDIALCLRESQSGEVLKKVSEPD